MRKKKRTRKKRSRLFRVGDDEEEARVGAPRASSCFVFCMSERKALFFCVDVSERENPKRALFFTPKTLLERARLQHTTPAHAHARIVKEVHAPPSDVVCDRFEVFVSPFVGLLQSVFLFFERSRRCFREIEQQQQQQQTRRRGDTDEKKKLLRFENDERDNEQ